MANRFGMEYEGGGYGSPNPSTPGSIGAGSSKIRKGYDEQNLIPITICMVLGAEMPEGILKDGREPHQVKLVAAVRDVTPGSTNITYSVEDGTGLIDVKEWVDTDTDNTATLQFRDRVEKEGRYVRIIGKIADYEGKKEIIGYAVRPLIDPNELTHHMLEVVHSAENYKRGNQIVGAPNIVPYGGNTTGLGFEPGSMQAVTPVKDVARMGMMGGAQSQGLKELLLDYIRNDVSSSNSGSDILQFIAQNSAKFSETEIRNTVSEISSEGLIYSTIDENHYTGV